jgi:hypothetical protein
MNRDPADRNPADHARSALLRALVPHIVPFTLLGVTSHDWASALFVGARHRLAIAIEGEDAPLRAERISHTIAEIDLAMQGGFVADIAVVDRLDGPRPILAIEALTIDEPEEMEDATTHRGLPHCQSVAG